MLPGCKSFMCLPPSTKELLGVGAPVTLRDGARIRLRQGHRSDRDLLVRGFEHLSPESRYRRFLTAAPELREDEVRYLTQIDHHNHEAIVALDDKTGEGIGVARYIRDPKRHEVAEGAVAVTDEWQGRGVGTLLLEVLGARAQAEGIRTFTALVLATNRKMLDVLAALGPIRIVDRAAGTVELEMPIPKVGLPGTLRKLLHVCSQFSSSEPPGVSE